MTPSADRPILTLVKIELVFEEDDVLPCLCKIRPVLTAFPSAQIVIDPAHVGKVFAEKLQRARVPVELKETQHG